MEVLISTISLIIAITIALIPYFRTRYLHGPELTIEIIQDGGMSSPIGLSSKNVVNSEGIINDETALKIFELKWKFRLIIRNNSDCTAYYPKIHFIQSKPKLTQIDPLNKLKPLNNIEKIELKATYSKFQECQGKDRIKTTGLPSELKNLKILIESKNGKKMRFYTLYSIERNENIFIRKIPKEFKK